MGLMPMIVNPCALCQVHSRRLHVPTLDMSGIPLCSWIYNHNARHSLVWWVVAFGHRWKQVLRFLFHIASLWIQWKQNETNIFYDICMKSVYYIYIYLYLSVMCQIRLKPAQSLIHRNERCQKSEGSCMSSLFTANGSLDLPYFTAQIRSVLFATASSWTPRHSKLKSQRCFNVS